MFLSKETFKKLIGKKIDPKLERKAGLIRNELKNVITEFEKPGILFLMENLQEAWKNFWLMSGDSWNAENIKNVHKLINYHDQ